MIKTKNIYLISIDERGNSIIEKGGKKLLKRKGVAVVIENLEIIISKEFIEGKYKQIKPEKT